MLKVRNTRLYVATVSENLPLFRQIQPSFNPDVKTQTAADNKDAVWQSVLSSESNGLTTFHRYLQSLPPCLLYIEHILLQRHTPAGFMHRLTTSGRVCAVEEPLLRFYPLTVSISCTHTDTDLVQGCCCCCCPNHPLSPQPIRDASQVHILWNL